MFAIKGKIGESNWEKITSYLFFFLKFCFNIIGYSFSDTNKPIHLQTCSLFLFSFCIASKCDLKWTGWSENVLCFVSLKLNLKVG